MGWRGAAGSADAAVGVVLHQQQGNGRRKRRANMIFSRVVNQN